MPPCLNWLRVQPRRLERQLVLKPKSLRRSRILSCRFEFELLVQNRYRMGQRSIDSHSQQH